MWRKVCKYHVFHDILRVCIFLKKTVTSTRSLPIERMTYHDMFHKNLQVSYDQILTYFLSSFIGFNHVCQLQLLQQQRTSQVKTWNWKKTFSLVSVGIVIHSFLIVFAWLTMFIVKLDLQFIRKINRLDFSFRKPNRKSRITTAQIRMRAIDVAYQTDVLNTGSL